MRAYRLAWLTISAILALTGTAAAFMLWSVPTTLVIFGCAAAVVGVATASLYLAEGTTTPPRDLMSVVTTKAAVAGIATVSVLGYGALLGAAALPVLFLVAGGSPSAIAFYRQRLGSSSSPRQTSKPASPCVPQACAPVSTKKSTPQPLGPALSAMDDMELCMAWRRSFTALQRASSPSDRMRIVEARRNYLDELGRRNPEGLAAWLGSGARAAGDPSKLLAKNSDVARPND